MTAQPKFKFSLIVLNWLHWEETLRCVQDFIDSRPADCLIVVVENGSPNGSAAELSRAFADRYSAGLSSAEGETFEAAAGVKIFLGKFVNNAGFAGGVNRGIKLSMALGAQDVMLLNNDARISFEDILKLQRCSQENGDALVGPVVYDFDHRQKVLFSGRQWPQLLYDGGEIPCDLNKTQWSTGYIEGSAVYISRAFLQRKLEKDGYIFDEDFFLYCEDVDLSLSAQNMGLECLIYRPASAFHKVSYSSGGLGNETAYFYITRNRVYLIRRWLSAPFRILFHAYYIPSRAILSLKRVFSARGRGINRAVWKGLWQAYFSQQKP